MEKIDKLVTDSIIGETDSVRIGDSAIENINGLISWVQETNNVDRETAKDLIVNNKVLLKIAFVVA